MSHLAAGTYRMAGRGRWVPLAVLPTGWNGWRTWLRPWRWRGASVHVFGYSAYVVWISDRWLRAVWLED